MEHTLVWLELASDDVAVSRGFWSALFGWEMLETEAVVSLRVGAADGVGASIKVVGFFESLRPGGRTGASPFRKEEHDRSCQR